MWKAVAADFGRLLGLAFVMSLAVGLLLTAAAVAVPAPLACAEAPLACAEAPLKRCERPADAQSGSFFMRRTHDEPWASAPMLDTEVSVRVSGLVARAKVVQRFRNGSDEWVEGIYVFPLPPQSAVDHLRMRVGERTIEGQIREREQARAEYQQAKTSGKKASLVEQERPNVFTTSVANLGPGEELVVEIELQETLDFDEGEVRLRFPLVVGPRYVPGSELVAGLAGVGWSPDTDQVKDASRVTPPVLPPGEAPRNPVRIDVELDAGFPIDRLASRYHAIVSERRGDSRYHVRLRDDLVPADRDYELLWTPQPGTMPRGAVFVEERGGSTYALVTLFPPVGPAVDASRLSREVIYVIDTSGSMEGASIQQAKKALGLAIDRLRPGDRFNVIQFNSLTDTLFDSPRPVTPETRASAREWVDELQANGGTELAAALEAALAGSGDDALVRQVVFLTDGCVANEEQLFGIIHARLGDTRLFTVGIGSAPNGHFMTKAAEFGHGTFTYIGDVREVEEKMGRLFAVLESPVLTGIEVSWPVGAAVESWPQRVGDLYLGEPIVLSARFEGKTPSERPADERASQVTVTGQRLKESWSVRLPIAHGRTSDGVAVLWAQRKVRSLVDSTHDGANPEQLRSQIVALGLEHHLVTPHTSLVAVDVTPTRPEGAALKSGAVPTNLPHGWVFEPQWGGLPQTATPAPLHASITLVALVLAALSRAGRRTRPTKAAAPAVRRLS
jgi:Ca-activated chloride channel family protein